MKHIPDFISFINEATYSFGKKELTDNFINYINKKLNIKIGSFIQAGLQGELYKFDNDKVIKFGSLNEETSVGNVYVDLYLKSNPIEGCIKVFDIGKVSLDKNQTKGFAPKGSKLSSFNENEPYIIYTIKELISTPKELFNTINSLNNEVFDKIDNTLKILDSSYPVSLSFLNYLSEKFRQDDLEFINSSDFKEWIQGELTPYQFEVFNRIYEIMTNLYSEKIVPADLHEGQFGMNDKKEIILFDVDNVYGKRNLTLDKLKIIK